MASKDCSNTLKLLFNHPLGSDVLRAVSAQYTAKLKIFCTNVELISVTKQFGFGLNVLGQNSRQKSVRRGQGTTQIGSGTWMKPENLWQILQEKMRAKIEASIPNKKKLPYTLLVRPYRELILESLMEGKDIDLVFDDIVFEPIND